MKTNRAPTEPPHRIVCLTEETTETLYLLEEDERIVGISGYTVRPARARREKPRISAFTSANIDGIRALRPDLVLAFSDLQADIAAALIRAGLEVHVFNQRTVTGIFSMVRSLGALVGADEKASALIASMQDQIDGYRERANRLERRPKVYFEEWNDPLISGIGWVSEIIEIAGGEDCFRELGAKPDAGGRVISDPDTVVARRPDIIIGSWCGKKFRPEKVAARPGWAAIPAVANGAVHEIKSPLILQPGPAAILEGLPAIANLIARWHEASAQ